MEAFVVADEERLEKADVLLELLQARHRRRSSLVASSSRRYMPKCLRMARHARPQLPLQLARRRRLADPKEKPKTKSHDADHYIHTDGREGAQQTATTSISGCALGTRNDDLASVRDPLRRA